MMDILTRQVVPAAARRAEPGGFGDKFRLLYTVATDPRASRAHSAVMGVILWRYNASHGCCWPSIASIAEDAGVDPRTVQRALDALEDWRYLHTARHRGRLNRYVPHFQAQEAPQGRDAGTGDHNCKGRHFSPQVTTSPFKGDGMHVVPPTARTPPESLNESIPESERKKKRLGCSLGNQESAPDGAVAESKYEFATGSPERRAEVRKLLLDASKSMATHMPMREYQERVGQIEAEYLATCASNLREPDVAVFAMLQKPWKWSADCHTTTEKVPA